ncbi:hypothetical protein B0I35DRAFT_475009 [Stachybotrys elegans]|uniref:C3H1-type domain-containing protein n=1 Tax=Stachybotrys elegans TaxID=80388 RepID=A0A8K0T1S4_9HYPO|nr:hypothetical protein B0I35DRAFT_475009 [Stachybotrys elegans]
MSGYGYGPPPPPPPPSASSGQASYGHNSSSYHGSGSGRHGAGSGRGGRGGHHSGGRGNYHNSSAPAAHYEYPTQPYAPHSSAPYGSSHPPPGPYPTPQAQWNGGPPPGQSHTHTLPHAPVPLSSSNYHPNYAPQPYPPSQYAQQPPYGPPEYSHPYQPPPPHASQWSGQGPSHQQSSYGGGRHRGGYNDRGASKHPPMGQPVRQGYEHEAPPPPMNGVYSHPYPHDPHAGPYPAPYSYGAPPPPPSGPPHHRDSYYGHHNRRGRGGGSRDGSMRGRGGHHGNDRSRHQKPSNNDAHVRKEAPSVGKKKKRKMNTLGLTPGMESESEDDEGEEKFLTELIGQDTLSVNDVAAFLAERRKNFPTKARVEAKKAAQANQSSEDKAASLEKQADKLRKQLRKVESSIKRKREQGDEGDEMRDSSTEDTSDDEGPEVMSSRPPQTVPNPPTPGKKADVSRHCKYFSTGGTCGKKGKCRFVHDPEIREAAMKEREANNGRLTIQQRLILNDKEQEDLTVLQSIQYLRDKGLMPAAPPGEAQKTGDEKTSGSKTGTSLLPAASASLPPLPVKREAPSIKREPGTSRRNPPPSIIPNANNTNAQGLKHYQGWLLKPYGSSNGPRTRSDDLP